MKTIFAATDPNNFYRVVIDDQILKQIEEAKKWLDNCPFNGEIRIPIKVFCLNTESLVNCDVAMFKDTINILIRLWGLEDHLLEWDDDLLKLPDVYLTRRFRLMIEDAKKYLSQDDVGLVDTWNKYHAKILEN